MEESTMKKAFIGLALALALLGGTAALAVDSPEATPNNNAPHTQPVSPKTADVSTLAFAGAGAVCLGGAVFCVTKARNG